MERAANGYSSRKFSSKLLPRLRKEISGSIIDPIVSCSVQCHRISCSAQYHLICRRPLIHWNNRRSVWTAFWVRNRLKGEELMAKGTGVSCDKTVYSESTGNGIALLHEIAHALHRYVDTGESRTIDLQRIPLCATEENQLREKLRRRCKRWVLLVSRKRKSLGFGFRNISMMTR